MLLQSSCYVLLLRLGGLLLSWNLEAAKLDWIWIVCWFIFIDHLIIIYFSFVIYMFVHLDHELVLKT